MGPTPPEPIPWPLVHSRTRVPDANHRVHGARTSGHKLFISATSGPVPFDVADLGSIGVRAYAVLSVQRISGIVKVQIFDGHSGELVRELRPEELLAFAAQAQAYQDIGHRRMR